MILSPVSQLSSGHSGWLVAQLGPNQSAQESIRPGAASLPGEGIVHLPIGREDLLWKLHGRIKPILSDISSEISAYTDDDLCRIVEANSLDCGKIVLRLKKAGLTDGEAVDCIARKLARQAVIQPRQREIAKIFQSFAEEDPQVRAFLKRDSFTEASYGRLLSGDFMEKHRYGPLQERMKQRLKPHVGKALAPILAQGSSGVTQLKNLFSRLLSISPLE